jgi:hypothetical protein
MSLPAGDYAIMVEGYASLEGAFQLNVACGTPAAAAIFQVTSSTPSGACGISADGSCFTDGSGDCKFCSVLF